MQIVLIVLKEARESHFWIKLIVKARLLSGNDMDALSDETRQIGSIIAKSIVTARNNR
jgi:four helix bundle protein